MKIAKIAAVLARIVLGGLLVFSGSNKLLHFMPMPPQPPAGAAFLMALAATGYMITLLGVIETVFGLLVIAGRYVPLALVVLAPIVVNIALYHSILAPAPPIVVILLASEIYLAWVYRHAFRGLFHAGPPTATSTSSAA